VEIKELARLPECTEKCGRRTDTGGMCRFCLDEMNTIVQRYIILKSPTKEIAEKLLVWWFS